MKSHNQTTKLITRVNQQFSHLIRRLPSRPAAALVVVLLFGVIGTILLTGSKAATPTVNLEAEAGSTNGCVTQLTDTSASQNGAVKFGSCNANDPTQLDSSGATIPDTNYAIPAGAIFMSPSGSDSNAGTQAAPVKTLNQAVALAPTGGTIVLRGGTYRDWYNDSAGNYKIATKAGITLQAYPHEQPWFDGSDVVAASSWTSDGVGHWYMDWSTPKFCDGGYYSRAYNAQDTSASNTGPCTHWDQYGSTSANYPAAGDPQMVFVNGARMTEVDTLASASGGKFFYDWTNKRIYISTNPSGNTIELAARPVALVYGASPGGLSIKGIGFRRYASNEYDNLTKAAIFLGGAGNATFEKDVFTQMAGSGLGLASPNGVTITNSIFAYNGFDGVSGRGHASTGATDNLVVQNNVFNYNNLENYGLNCTVSCAAAGMKLGNMVGYTVKNNIFENTQGNGHRGTGTGVWCDTGCSNGVFVNNLVKNNQWGYHYEQDDSGIIAGNLVLGGQYGIRVSATNTKIYNNTVINSSVYGISAYDDNRPLVTSGISVANNVVYGNGTGLVWMDGGGASGSVPANWFSSTPFDYNSYYRPSNVTLYRWTDSADSFYSSLTSFRTAHSALEAHAQDVLGGSDPFFTNLSSGDYSIRTNSTAYLTGGIIPADVAAALGVPATAGQTRGAFSWPGQ